MWRDTFKFHPLLRSSDCSDIPRSEALPKMLRVGNTVADHLNVAKVAIAQLGERTPGQLANDDPRYTVLCDALRLGRR